MPRPPDSSISIIIIALIIFIHVPQWANAQNAQQKRLTQPHLARPTPQGKSTNFENNYNNNEKNYNAYNSHDVRAIATTLAPAATEKEAAVRAPLAQRPPGTTGGLSRLSARSLQDWDVEDVVLLATVDGKIYARDRRSGAPRWELEADRPVVETIYHPRNRSIDGKSSVNDEVLWIVEPSQNGQLYGYVPGVSPSINSLGLSIKDLHENTPFVSDDPPIRYLVDRKTLLYTIDVSNGNVQKMFSPGSSALLDENSCRKVGSFESLDDEECPITGTLNLGRTEYTVQISSTITSELICTIRYFEWGPNQRDKDLINQYATTKDNRYVYTRYDGQAMASQHLQEDGNSYPSKLNVMYAQKFQSPVAQVFDVARPTDDDSPDAPLIILPQPSAPMSIGNLQYDVDRVFVNCTEAGSWYALSEYNYPMVTAGASDAPCLDERWRRSMPELRGTSLSAFKTALTGVHDLRLVGQSSNEITIPLIGGPPEPRIDGMAELETISPPASSNWSVRSTTSIILVLIAILSLVVWPNTESFKPAKLPLASDTTVGDLAPPPTEQDEGPQTDSRAGQEQDSVATEHSNKDPIVMVNQVPAETSVSDTVTKAVPSERQQEDVEVPEAPRTVSPKKKKAHRGNRGGRAQREKEKAKNAGKVREGSQESLAEQVQQSADEVNIQPDVINKHVPLENTPNGLHNLNVRFDHILGSGSGGTFVFEGSFEGRDVAVKRMLRQQYELASQEVSLLEQSDEHTNVIRYFCRREDENFLYIALELCQASLWDLFRDGRGADAIDSKQLALRDEILQDPRRVLRQLAEGLRYLHSFRIVHRDIKPQNMLVAYPKRNNLKSFPRLVISDFGLCKTLPENVSTLLGTTGNAGTAGWMAPELILQPNENGSSGSQQSTQRGEPTSNRSSALMNGNGVNSSGKVKRAIDIFSLGCVFFYVLTQGQHAFDDEEGWMALRERNIKIGRAKNMKALEMFGPDTVDLITWMLQHEPEDRPTAAQVLAHPFFWDAQDRLEFLSAASDRFDQESRDGSSAVLKGVEACAEDVIPKSISSASYAQSATHSHLRRGSSHEMATTMALPIPECNFLAALDRRFVETLGRQRKYDPGKLTDLLRALRNKHHHWDDMPDEVKAKVGEVPEGYLHFWESRFPALVVQVWRVVTVLGVSNERRFARWFANKGN